MHNKFTPPPLPPEKFLDPCMCVFDHWQQKDLPVDHWHTYTGIINRIVQPMVYMHSLFKKKTQKIITTKLKLIVIYTCRVIRKFRMHNLPTSN